MDAFLVIDKPQGLSSQQAVIRLRRALRVEKAGHTGTLDPLATGVLPVALGEATKIIPFLDEAVKAYRVTGILGVTTDTYDAEGRETARAPWQGISRDAVSSVLAGLTGEIDQVPPPFSAVKRAGKPLYAYARAGETVAAAPRRITVTQLELEDFSPPAFTLHVVCSKGTYIRSLVHDAGQRLGCGAHVSALRRTRSGPFLETDALSLETLLALPETARSSARSIEACLQHLPLLPLESEREAEQVRQGVPLRRISELIENNKLFGKTLVLAWAEKIIAVIHTGGGGYFGYGRVLNR